MNETMETTPMPTVPTCNAHNLTYRRIMSAAGEIIQIRAFCLTCGKGEPSPPMSCFTRSERFAFAEYNRKEPDSIRNKFYSVVFDERQKQKDDASAIWWENYDAYLRSAEWQERRRRVLYRDNHLCQCCLNSEATQVHHLSYARVGNEPGWHLASVCTTCHESIHAKEDTEE